MQGSCMVRSIGVFRSILAGMLLLGGAASAGATTWQIETLETGLYLYDPSVAVDSGGTPHVSYKNGDRRLAYATRTGAGAWNIEIVSGVSNINGATSMAMDADDHPHIASSWATDWYYSTHDGNGWSTTMVWDGGWNGSNCGTSLKLDNMGNPYVSFDAWTPSDSSGHYAVGLAAWNGSGFDVEIPIQENHTNGAGTGLALDAVGNPHIVYKDYVSSVNYLKYTGFDGSAWSSPYTLATGGGEGTMVTDSDGNIHLSYTKDYRLTYRVLDAQTHTWSSPQTIDPTNSGAYYTSIALDAFGMPCIAYSTYTGPNRELRYAAYDGAEWAVDIIDDSYSGLSPALAFDSGWNIHIAYEGRNANNDYLIKYAFGEAPAVPEPVSVVFFATGLAAVAGLVARRQLRK